MGAALPVLGIGQGGGSPGLGGVTLGWQAGPLSVKSYHITLAISLGWLARPCLPAASTAAVRDCKVRFDWLLSRTRSLHVNVTLNLGDSIFVILSSGTPY
ncbi:hypothetical protein PoB_003064900 [Plakobranchus ocellatus]|uniref:Uncharacterized protein n=1 Tax=Plakobranchus ocellatus TaxID=259542 RepID=A0AAV4A912_9GAST|nr:hypothetical protein PoB_003064900 [Plakobranchus ocellatus]